MEPTRPLLSFFFLNKNKITYIPCRTDIPRSTIACITISTCILVARNTNGSSITPTNNHLRVLSIYKSLSATCPSSCSYNQTTDRIKSEFIFLDHSINLLYIIEFRAEDFVDVYVIFSINYDV